MKNRSFADTASIELLSVAPASRRGRALLLLAAVLLVSQASVSYAQTPNTVTLAPDTCPEVRDGDIVTFTFTPQFDNTAAVRGIRNVDLKFLRGGQPDPANAPEAEFTLHAVPRRGEQQAPEAPMVAAAGGSIQFRFRANLRSTSRGTFYLVAITGDPLLAPGYQGNTPKIINAVGREHLCLQVAPPY